MDGPVLVESNNDTRNTVVQFSVARSGSTLLSNLINYDGSYRYLFEPLHESVPHSELFRYTYLRAGASEPEKRAAMETILSGRLRHQFVDRRTTPGTYQKRLVKFIRANLCCLWVAENFPEAKYIFLVRNPFATVVSILAAGWAPGGRKPSREFCEDFGVDPELFDRFWSNAFEQTMLLWCANNIFVTRLMSDHRFFVIHFEDLFSNDARSVHDLFAFLGQRYSKECLRVLERPSSTTRLSGRYQGSKTAHVKTYWSRSVSSTQLRVGRQILKAFGLDQLYDRQGRPTGSRTSHVGQS